MITDDERREVARRLRKCTPPTSYRQSQGGGWAHLCDMALAVGFKREDNPTAWEFAQRLADLIEPTRTCSEPTRTYEPCDRDALFVLADELEEDARWEVQSPGVDNCAWRLKDVCDRIREALGVTS